MASSQSLRSHQLVLTWRRAERDINPPLQQDVNIFSFSFCETCRKKGAFGRRKIWTEWMLSLLMEFVLFYHHCARRSVLVMQPLGSSSFTCRTSERQLNYSLDFQQVLCINIPSLPLLTEGSPWPGAAWSCVGQLSSALLTVLANGVCTSLTFCGQSFLSRKTSTACAAAGLQHRLDLWHLWQYEGH